ncbi:MAG: 2-C-methyl-D-erythritol 4-phosphate cytidylyltransferase [Desulfobacteraceae bacterium]|nr:2-C-methyl-D-erythritol 4-phosphate cytidylyltransferase [Desulfobacteraceae bacterium]
MISVLIVAAGKGVRMGAVQPKQYLPLNGQAILWHTLKAFDLCPVVDRIVVAVSSDQLQYCRHEVLGGQKLRSQLSLVEGGKHRQDSVFNGLEVLEEDGIVLIHDGVRPLVSVDLIQSCIHGAQRWGACIPVIEVTDTLKQINEQGVIARTVPRDTLRMAQTPQAFEVGLIKEAHRLARRNHIQATDDASLVEQMGAAVHVIPGSVSNIKITTPEDLQRAEMILVQGRR